MIAYKFLAQGGHGPISQVAWPLPSDTAPGAWLEATDPLSVCSHGVHVCHAEQLPHWLSDELYEVETAGQQLVGVDCVVVSKARLVRRVDCWSEGGALQFARASIEHAAEVIRGSADASLQALLEDGEFSAAAGYFAVSAYCAALVVARHLAPSHPEPAFREERRWQGGWIARELLQLPTGAA